MKKKVVKEEITEEVKEDTPVMEVKEEITEEVYEDEV